jgi:streptogramin lyase
MKYRDRMIALAVVLIAPTCLPVTPPIAAPELLAAQLRGQFRSFPIPSANSEPRHITLGSDGNMWFTESRLDFGKIGRIDARGNITEFPVPNPSSQPDDIVSGPDDALWFTGPSGFPDFFIGRVTTAGVFTGFDACEIPGSFCSIVPQGIAAGPDGNLWFTERLNNAIVRMTTQGTVTYFPIPTADANPAGITAGPDGALWFTEFNANAIGRITTAGVITEFPGVSGSPSRITTGPDGNLWFTEPFPFDNRIGRITTAGVITEFQLTGPSSPQDIVAGPDGNLWFTEFDGERLSQITPAGVVTEVQRVRGGPFGIGRDGELSIWLTQLTGNRIGRFRLR